MAAQGDESGTCNDGYESYNIPNAPATTPGPETTAGVVSSGGKRLMAFWSSE